MDDVTGGTLEFLFVIMGCGFTLVSVLDYLYDRYTSSHPQVEEKKS
jgi:type III secretory pathway component EscU